MPMPTSRKLLVLPAALVLFAIPVALTQFSRAQTAAPAHPDPAVEADRVAVEDAKLRSALAGTCEVWIEGKTDKPFCTGTYVGRHHIGNLEFLEFSDGAARIFVRVNQVTAIRVIAAR